MEIKKRAMRMFGYLRQSYFAHVSLVPPYRPKRPHGWGSMGRFSGKF